MTFVNYFPGRGTVMEKAYLEGEAKGEARGEAKAIPRFLKHEASRSPRRPGTTSPVVPTSTS
ncbi:hypothetical protein [Streptomyces tuirus]